MTSALKLARSHLLNVTPYASARRSMSGGQLWLNANELAYSQSYQVDTTALNRYPDFQSGQLNQAFARYTGVKPEQLLSHRGSDESIDLLVRSFCEPGRDRILICPPTYGMYAVSAGLNNTPVVNVPLTGDNWQLDLKAIKASAEAVRLVFLCNPSNPLGNALNREDMIDVIEYFQGKALVVVDEAYIEFSQHESCTNLLDQYDNLVIMRTLSKAFGLAAIRVGFTLASESVIELLGKVLAPYPLPQLSIQIATQALDPEHLIQTRQNVIEVQGERERLCAQLQAMPFVQSIWPSETNFLLLKVTDAHAISAFCSDAGILLRDQSRQPGLTDCIRITVGAPADNDFLLQQLQRYGETS